MLGPRQTHASVGRARAGAGQAWAGTKAQRVLIVQPNEDVRELLAEHCRRMGLEPVMAGGGCAALPPGVDAIVADPASPAGQRLLAAPELERRATPIVFASIYPPAGRLTDSPAVAYLVLPCPWERFERALGAALGARR